MKFRPARISLLRRFTSAFVTLCALVVLSIGRESSPTTFFDQQMAAARQMRACMDSLSVAQTSIIPEIDTNTDPNETGLIGVEYSPITTTLGSLVAKRTSTNPDFAALLVRWFHHLEVREGDIVAIGCSGSFPALALATVCAAEAMQLRPIVIISLGASSFGANRPEWTYLDMEEVLYKKGMIHHRSRAASLGGTGDTGLDLTAEGHKILSEAARRYGVPLIQQSTPAENVQVRAGIYQQDGRPKLFVNIGGSQINIGDYISARRLSVGPNLPASLTANPPESMIAYFAKLGIPTLHLLLIEQTAVKHNLAVDPRPLPEPGLSPVYYTLRIAAPIWILAAVCTLASWTVLIWPRRHLSPRRPCQSALPGRGESATDRPAPHR
ncbi:MAG: poly-gamma-glutamate system protein [Candidatus Neomarinimicrobiota bacterium]